MINDAADVAPHTLMELASDLVRRRKAPGFRSGRGRYESDTEYARDKRERSNDVLGGNETLLHGNTS